MGAEAFLAFLAVATGVLGGLAALFFFALIRFATSLFMSCADRLLPLLGSLRFVATGFAGGLLVGPFIYLFAREARGHGVPEVIYAVARNGGRIRGRVAVVKALASAVTIGSGGSAGQEGPIAQIGAAIGSAVGQALRLSDRGIITLVACGVAAGISGIFNAPFAGALYAIEVVMEGAGAGIFGYVFVSAVVADLVVWSLKGNAPVFTVVPYALTHPLELLLYGILGAAAAVVAWLFMKAFYGAEDLFRKLTFFPEWLLPALGGIAFGLFGALLPQTLGRGEGVVAQILDGNLNSAGLLAALCFAKILSTSITLGSGGSGGVLFPALFIGASLGGSLGSVFHSLLPGLTAGSGSYAVVGMAALFAAANHAPVTAVLLVVETTRNYSLIIPLMLSCGVATLLSRALSRENIDTMKLARRGVFLHREGSEQGVSASVMMAPSVQQKAE